MTDKVQKIKEFLIGMAGAACCDAKTKKIIETNILPFIDSLQEEPVSEDLGLYINELSKQFPEVSFAKLSRIAVRVAKWQKEHLLKSSDGNDLSEPVSEDLEEASKKYASNNTPWDDCVNEMQESFKAGAKWQRDRVANK